MGILACNEKSRSDYYSARTDIEESLLFHGKLEFRYIFCLSYNKREMQTLVCIIVQSLSY